MVMWIGWNGNNSGLCCSGMVIKYLIFISSVSNMEYIVLVRNRLVICLILLMI